MFKKQFLIIITVIFCFFNILNIKSNEIKFINKNSTNFNLYMNKYYTDDDNVNEDDEKTENEEDSEGWAYILAGIVAFPVVLGIIISELKYYNNFAEGYSENLSIFAFMGTLLGGASLLACFLTLLITNIYSGNFLPMAIYSTVMTGVSLINFIVGIALYTYSLYDPNYFIDLHNDIFKNIFIGSTVMLGFFSICTIIFWIIHFSQYSGTAYNSAPVIYKKDNIKVSFDGLEFLIQF